MHERRALRGGGADDDGAAGEGYGEGDAEGDGDGHGGGRGGDAGRGDGRMGRRGGWGRRGGGGDAVLSGRVGGLCDCIYLCGAWFCKYFDLRFNLVGTYRYHSVQMAQCFMETMIFPNGAATGVAKLVTLVDGTARSATKVMSTSVFPH